MKKIYSLIVALGLLFPSCDSYFDVELYQNIPAETAYNTVSDITNNLTSAYYALGTYRFQGRDVVAVGDIAADNAVANASKGWFVSINAYTYAETTGEFSDMWTFGYQIVDRATRNINGAKALLEKGNLSEEHIATLNTAIAQCYALRAYAAFTMVNLFGLPYGTDNYAHGGLVIVEDKPIELKEMVSRASVNDTYAWILRDIAKANSTPNDVESDVQFYFSNAAIKALEARVNLYMKNYTVAKDAALKALDLRGAAEISNKAYIDMWGSTAISPEDILTVVKSSDDNLSANSLNTLYSTYKAAVTADLIALFQPNDIRKQLISGTHPKKFDGIPGAAAVSNIPVFRVSEMYLIIAECEALDPAGSLSAAQTALFYTAKRNTDITAANMLPSTKDELVKFISQERRREFFEEGQRWYDVRRTGELISLYNGKYTNFDLSKLVYPIPSTEINAGYGTEQNPNWKDVMPR